MKSAPSAEPLSDPEGDVALRPPLTLEALRDRARAMESSAADRDALLDELSRAPESDEDLRARADVLRLIFEDPWLGGHTGSDGRRVDGVAARALVDLGEPYASELSPEGHALLGKLAAEPPPKPVRQGPAASEPEPGNEHFRTGQMIATVLGGLELLVVIGTLNTQMTLGGLLLLMTAVGLGTLAPAWLPTDDTWNGVRQFLTVIMGLVAVPPLVVSIPMFIYAGPWGLLPLAVGVTRLVGAISLFRPPASEPALVASTDDDDE